MTPAAVRDVTPPALTESHLCGKAYMQELLLLSSLCGCQLQTVMALPAFFALLPAQGHLKLAQLSTPSLFPILPRCTAEKHQATCTRASSAFVFLHYSSSRVPRIRVCRNASPGRARGRAALFLAGFLSSPSPRSAQEDPPAQLPAVSLC